MSSSSTQFLGYAPVAIERVLSLSFLVILLDLRPGKIANTLYFTVYRNLMAPDEFKNLGLEFEGDKDSSPSVAGQTGNDRKNGAGSQ